MAASDRAPLPRSRGRALHRPAWVLLLTSCASPAPPPTPAASPPAPPPVAVAARLPPRAPAPPELPPPPTFPAPMVELPKITFTMGCDAEPCGSDEGPTHSVTVSAFAIDAFEVTAGHYQACVAAGHCLPFEVPDGVTGEDLAAAERCRRQLDPTRGRHAVVCVTPFQADKYCEWRGKRLPTEAEWERAARGAAGRPFPWGAEAPTAERVCVGAGPCPVGTHPAGASPEGIHDLLGNAAEWVIDGYHPTFYAQSSARDPDGFQGLLPERHRRCGSISCRVARGGSFLAATPRTTARRPEPPMDEPWRYADVGFRCAKSVGRRLREPCTRCRFPPD